MDKRDYATEIGKRLKKERENLGLNQTEFGDLFGYTQKSISDFERGVVLLPTDAAIKICSILHLTLDYLLTGVQVDYPQKIKEDGRYSSIMSLYEICPEETKTLCVNLIQQVVTHTLSLTSRSLPDTERHNI